MRIPFTAEQFFRLFAQYNESVWPMQFVLNLLAFAAIVLLIREALWQGRLISAVLSFFWAWMAIAYHFLYFTAINPVAWLFGAIFLAGAFGFAWTGMLKSRLQFQIRSGVRGWAGGLLIGFALLVYPLLGYLLGHHYPAVPTFGLPCPTAILTVGICCLRSLRCQSLFSSCP
jgi:peptidoglycan/LPS O-acetylase OafA/YrhL